MNTPRVLYLAGETGLGKTTTIKTLTSSRYAYRNELSPRRFDQAYRAQVEEESGPGNWDHIKPSIPSCYGYTDDLEASRDTGRWPVVDLSPPGLRVEGRDNWGRPRGFRSGRYLGPWVVPEDAREEWVATELWLRKGFAASETSCIVSHRFSVRTTTPPWFRVAAECGWDVHLVVMFNRELARQRRQERLAKLSLPVHTIGRMAFDPLHSAQKMKTWADDEGEDYRETERLLETADAEDGVTAHRLDVGPDDTPGDVASKVAEFAGLSDVLGPRPGSRPTRWGDGRLMGPLSDGLVDGAAC